jgi:hypothetical protein
VAAPSGAIKQAELAASLGAGVLGAGLALVAPPWLRSYAPLLLLLGLAVHGVGMSLKYRLESRQGSPVWWERFLFWGCWASLAAVFVIVLWNLGQKQ